jgi:hypothetical protein
VSQARLAQSLADASAPEISRLANSEHELAEAMSRLIAPAVEEWKRWAKELPPRLQEALLKLGEHGWYLDPEMPLHTGSRDSLSK